MHFAAQTTSPFIDLLSAKSYFYDRAERLSDWEYAVALLTALSSIAVFFLPEELENYVALVGIASFFITTTFISKRKEELIRQGALVQEKFDTDLFELSKHDDYDTLTAELSTAKAYFPEARRKRHTKEGWYHPAPTDNKKLAILLAQRANLAWDWQLRQYHAGVLNIAFWILIIALALTALLFDLKFLTFLAQLFLPFLTLLWLLYDNARANKQLSEEQKAKELEINKLACEVHRSEVELTDAYLRSLQNTVYKNRANNPVLKYGWYKKKRSEYNANMINVTNNLLNNC